MLDILEPERLRGVTPLSTENDRPIAAPVSVYDELMNWDVRLGRELPFFRRLFDESGVQSVIDVGAGNARLDVEFAAWGLDVHAVEPAADMLELASINTAAAGERITAAGGTLCLLRGGFGQLRTLGLREADAIVCVGNALPHVDGLVGLRATLAEFAATLRPGGALVLQLLNHARLLASMPRTVPPIVRETPDGTRVFLRIIDYPEDGETLDFDFMTLTRDASGQWSLVELRDAHTALPVELLRTELAAAGFERIEAFGGHDGHALIPQLDENVIVVARRGGHSDGAR